MREPQEIEDEEREQVTERVAAVDVAKASRMVCTRVPHPSRPGWRTTTRSSNWAGSWRMRGSRRSRSSRRAITWRPFFYLLEAAGLAVQLVNAHDVKNAPGRPKTDLLDAMWLAKLTERGMLRPSFVPPAEIRQLRDCARLRTDLTRERARAVHDELGRWRGPECDEYLEGCGEPCSPQPR